MPDLAERIQGTQPVSIPELPSTASHDATMTAHYDNFGADGGVPHRIVWDNAGLVLADSITEIAVRLAFTGTAVTPYGRLREGEDRVLVRHHPDRAV